MGRQRRTFASTMALSGSRTSATASSDVSTSESKNSTSPLSSSQAADVLQETRPTGEAQPERTVLFSGPNGGVRRVDVVTAQQTGENEIPIVDYRIGGGVGAVLDPETGGLWIGSAQQVVAPDYPDEPDALVEPGSWLVVTSGGSPDDSGGRPDPGRVLIVDSSGWFEVELGADLEPLREEPEEGTDSDSSTPTVPETVPEPAATKVSRNPSLSR